MHVHRAGGVEAVESSLMSSRDRNQAWPFFVLLIAIVLAGAVLLTRYQPEIGVSAPGTGSRKATAAVADVAVALDEDVPYDEYSAVLRVAVATHRSMAVHNTADGRVERLLMHALDCYEAIREARQAQVEDAWDPQTHGVKDYWLALHPGLELAGTEASISYEELVRACGDQAEALLEEALTEAAVQS